MRNYEQDVKLNDDANKYRLTRQATIIAVLVCLLLGILKSVFGVMGRSHALLADGVHSFADVITDILVLYAAKYGHRDADSDHPYGHQRIETIGTVALALLVAFAGLGIIWDASYHLLFGVVAPKPALYVIGIAAFSIIANEGLFRYTRFISTKVQSELLLANAWHSRTDAAASIVVLLGVLGALAGIHYLDSLAAVIVAVMIIKMGWSLGVNGVRELIDTGVDCRTVEEITALIKSVPGVFALHELRTRKMAGQIFADVHVLVPVQMSVSEGHFIAAEVQRLLTEASFQIKDVTVHVDVEDDECSEPTKHLPKRTAVLTALQAACAHLPIAWDYDHITLHYVAGKIYIELKLPWQEVVNDLRAQNPALKACQMAWQQIPWVGGVSLLAKLPITDEDKKHEHLM